jgi:hypothetical protein
MSVKFSDRIIATATAQHRYSSVFHDSDAAKPKPPSTLTVRDLCIQAGIPEQANGKIPIAALDKALKIVGWSNEKRMLFKDEARRIGLID